MIVCHFLSIFLPFLAFLGVVHSEGQLQGVFLGVPGRARRSDLMCRGGGTLKTLSKINLKFIFVFTRFSMTTMTCNNRNYSRVCYKAKSKEYRTETPEKFGEYFCPKVPSSQKILYLFLL